MKKPRFKSRKAYRAFIAKAKRNSEPYTKEIIRYGLEKAKRMDRMTKFFQVRQKTAKVLAECWASRRTLRLMYKGLL